MKSAQPVQPVKFYCEFCGSQVRASDRICPHCGSMFSQVRCQSCGFQGESKLFLKGCPVCGFQGMGQGSTGKTPSKTPRKGLGGSSFDLGYVIDDGKKQKTPSQPAWTWILLVLALVAVVVIAASILHSGR